MCSNNLWITVLSIETASESYYITTQAIPHLDRCLLIQLACQSRNEYDTDHKPEIEAWYIEAETILKLTKPHDITIIIAKVGRKRVSNLTGEHDDDEGNDRIERLLEYC